MLKKILTFAASIVPEWAAHIPEISHFCVLHSFLRQGLDENAKPLSAFALGASTHRKSFAQVNPAHLHIVAQFVRRAGAEDPPFGDDISPVGYAQGLSHIVICD